MRILKNLVLFLHNFIEDYGFTGWFAIASVHIFVVVCAWSVPVLMFNPWAPYISRNPSPGATPRPVPLSTSQPAQETTSAIVAQLVTPTATVDIQPEISYDPGTYLVHEEIQPGYYRGEGGTESQQACTWARLRDLTEAFESIIVSHTRQGQFYLEVKASDTALQIYCTITSLDPNLPQVSSYAQLLPPGMYLIGADILPGRYRGQAGDHSCAWQRLSGVDGEPASLIADGDEAGDFVIEVLPSDFALSTNCELERIGD